ncbi:MAG: GTP-binding protein [Balneolales bacterium]|nr:GTP-binding protein [Balneolales bacterium]
MTTADSNASLAPETSSQRKTIPVTIITGFLGSGKTSLLNHILSSKEHTDIAVIQNEFGKISIDHELVLHHEEGIFEMKNGCICCTVRNDLLEILERLKHLKSKFSRIVIETTGLADPVPVAQTFFSSIHIQKDFSLDGIVTLVDARNVVMQLKETTETRQQIICGDILILNKTDLVNSKELRDTKELLRSLNEDAPILDATQGAVPVSSIFGVSLLDDNKLKEVEHYFDKTNESAKPGESHTHADHHHHHHDDDVSSLSLELDGSMDLERLDAWLNMINMLMGNRLYRMKGIINLPHEDRVFVFQSVFGILQGAFGREWNKNEARKNRFVFIGKQLNQELLKDGFSACISSDETDPKSYN